MPGRGKDGVNKIKIRRRRKSLARGRLERSIKKEKLQILNHIITYNHEKIISIINKNFLFNFNLKNIYLRGT